MNFAASGPTTSILPSVEASKALRIRAPCATLAIDRAVHVLARPGKIPGALPVPDILEDSALRFRPWMDGRATGRIEQLAPRVIDDRPNVTGV